MFYKFTPMGYFGRVSQISRGPWFAEHAVEEDGLEYYFMHQDSSGTLRYLLSNNMSYEDRTQLLALQRAQNRVVALGWGAGILVSLSVVSRVPYFAGMASGWKVLSFFAVAGLTKGLIATYYGRTYGPLIGAYLRKYQNAGTADAFEIRDRKREYYQIDDSSYTAYEEKDYDWLHKHANHGPQPDGMVLDSTYLKEVDNFLDGKENNLKGHNLFLDYNYEYVDKSYPSQEAAQALIEGSAVAKQ